MSAVVFVYGTLLSGEANHALLRNAERLAAEAFAHGALYDTGKGYPAMTLAGGRPDSDNRQDNTEIGEGRNPSCEAAVVPGIVIGELYAVDGPTLAALDALEDYYGPADPRNLYERMEIVATTPSVEWRALAYVFASERTARCLPIPHGDWRVYRSAMEKRSR